MPEPISVSATWFAISLGALVLLDASMTLWILTHNGNRINPLMRAPVMWWGPEGVMLTKTFVFLFVLWFLKDIPTWTWITLIIAYTLVCAWNAYQMWHMKDLKEVEQRIDRLISHVRHPPSKGD